ncbi:DUF1684 domain-containing protein [Pontibacter sp. G13]|uniref:DUF1684 domain-containing protein n=1 Tax=Pontibacter sp. G13 TaxID=3074898 RepID=UPI00288976B1|nr:DUF1684 domain-containing protein [Pontibacter sp. G13]WNJ20911.1 DUF1684 domain-containing protein [Pontibacter sp. G13]
MKKHIALLLLALICSVNLVEAGGEKSYIRKIKKHRKQTAKMFADPAQSPMRADAVHFEGLDYFDIDPAYRVMARVEMTPSEEPFMMPTSKADLPKKFVQYGILHFELQGQELQLPMYVRASQRENPQYIFVPFTDLTTGAECYGGGRYLDVEVPKPGEELEVDFNLCYNPYCAYGDGWACPIPPRANFLNIRVEAGVKNYQH